jgi:tetratricopeptide (TPR) repeat protein
VEELANVPAIALFVERAQAIRPGFHLTEENARDVAVVCRQLDGLPLALELAAIRLRTLSPQALARLLDQRLRLLAVGPGDAPARHRTLRAAMAWSYDLLTAEQQRMFRILGVFAGGCTFESAAALVAGGDPFIAVDGLEVLVDQGLVRRLDEPNGDVRFTMLETIRDYAVELLDERAEDTAIRSRHAESFLALAEQIEPQLHGSQPGQWLDLMEQEQDNFRAALAWSLGPTGDPVVALRLAVTLWPFWHMRGHHHEARTWLERTIAQGELVDPATRAGALLTLANVANNLEDHHQAEFLYGESLRLARVTGDARLTAKALVGLGMVATTRGNYPCAEQLLRDALATEATAGFTALYALGRLEAARGNYHEAQRVLGDARRLCKPDDIGAITYLSLELAQIKRLQGEVDPAARLAEDCLAQFREMGERRAEAATLAELGQLALLAGDLERAGDEFRDAAVVHRELRDELGLVVCLEGYATLAIRSGRPQAAALLGGAADAWRTRTGTRRTVGEQETFDQVTSAALIALNEEAVATAATWTAGGEMDLDQAMMTALELVTLKQ